MFETRIPGVYHLHVKHSRRFTGLYLSVIHRWRAKRGEPAPRRAAKPSSRRGKLPKPRQRPGGEANALFNLLALREMPRNLPGLTGPAAASVTRMTATVSRGSPPAGNFGLISCKPPSKESVPCFGARRSALPSSGAAVRHQAVEQTKRDKKLF